MALRNADHVRRGRVGHQQAVDHRAADAPWFTVRYRVGVIR